MKTFKITKINNQNSPVTKFNNPQIITSGNDLCLIVDRDEAFGLVPGGKIRFEKYASGNTGQDILVCEEDSTIKSIIDNGDKKHIIFDYVYIEPLSVSSFLEIETDKEYKYKFYFTSQHKMLPNDLFEYGDYKIYVKRGKNVIEYSGPAFCYPNDLVKGESIFNVNGKCCEDATRLFNYETMEKNSILLTNETIISGEKFVPESGDQVIFATNPYFHIVENEAILYTGVNVCKYTDFMDIGVALHEDTDSKRMFQEYQVNELYVNKIKKAIIPDFIDLEKVKYAPAFFEHDSETGTKMFLATGLTFNLHFRTRISGDTKYTFEDVWHIDDETNTWNSNGVDDTPKKRNELYEDEEFVNSSNLIGYLGFTDDDIYNQKNRVKQTFIRLSFYDSKDPLTQNLLYYSTIFLDSGDLFGKFVKRKTWLSSNEKYDENEYPVVWSSANTSDPCSAITCQMIVNDEYDMTRSGEGFNLYLFRADAPIENETRDIYMKVEFNHAGYGRTVPLIRWPKEIILENGKEVGPAAKLTVKDYLDKLYIPIQITLTDKGYVYSLPNAVSETTDDTDNDWRKNGIIWENERIIFNLFEPMIEQDWDEQ